MLLTFKGHCYVHLPWPGKDLISYHTLLFKFLSYVTSDKIALYKEKLQTSAQDPCKLQMTFSSLFTLPAPPSLSLTSDTTFFEGKIEKKKSARTLLLPWLLHYMFSTFPSYIFPKHIFFFLAIEEILQVNKSCNSTTCLPESITSISISPHIRPLQPFNSMWHSQPQDSHGHLYESWNLWHSMSNICFLPGGMIISSDTEEFHICLIWTIHWCPTRFSAWSSSVHPVYVISWWDHIYENMGFIQQLCILFFLPSLRYSCFCSDLSIL